MGRQLLISLSFLRDVPLPVEYQTSGGGLIRGGELRGVMHGDLKPENILLHDDRKHITLIDFGSACYNGHCPHSYFQSRFYRSPEALLSLPTDTAVDMWSLGCILFELHTGKPLFLAHDHVELLRRHVALLGMPPNQMVEDHIRRVTKPLFMKRTTAGSETEWELTNGYFNHSSLPSVIKRYVADKEYTANAQMYALFIDVLKKILTYDPKLRFTPEQALKHPFFKSSQQTTSHTATTPTAPPTAPHPAAKAPIFWGKPVVHHASTALAIAIKAPSSNS